MDVVLLERIESLGQMGDVVTVKDGYARNYLLPQGKAQRATATNLTAFADRRVELEARNLERRKEAEGVAGSMAEATFVVMRQAGESGQLYGSVQARDIVEGLNGLGLKVGRNQVILNKPIKALGLHSVRVNLHPEVQIEVLANVARSEAEAKRQAAGEDVLVQEEDGLKSDTSEVFEEASGDDDKDNSGAKKDNEAEAKP